jgi:SAM-dependent methyltransferase
MSHDSLDNWPEEVGLAGAKPPTFFRSLAELEEAKPPPQAHALRRAFEEMELDGVLCLEGTPAVYFKCLHSVDPGPARQLLRLVWNQGIAAVLILITPHEVRVHSGLVPPRGRDGDDPGAKGSLVRTLNRVREALEVRRLALSIQNGALFRDHPESFDPGGRVDRRLLQNLTEARSQLRGASSARLDDRILDALLCRVVFVSYLVDRKIIGPDYFQRAGAQGAERLADIFRGTSLERARQRLYRLFKHLQRDFNGDLFSGDLNKEAGLIEDAHVGVLERLLKGEELESGQLSFLDYDFSVIPVETISAIYEHFLAESDPEGKRKTGAFYTPRFLAELVVDVAVRDLPSLLDRRFLDPACGSGIFLVALFNRLAEEWRRRNPTASHESRFDALISILQRSLFGIDSNETACRIAAFSLYLALLDQLDPRDIHKLQSQGKMLPSLVFTPSGPPEGKILLHASFGTADSALPTEKFDLVIGNPPWVSRGGKNHGASKEEWPTVAEEVVAQKDLSQRFLWKAPQHLRPGGRVCFLLPDGVLFNHDAKALRFQCTWLERNALERVVNLADLRYQLFEHAIHPALIVRFRGAPPSRSSSGHIKAVAEYDVPKSNWSMLRADLLVLQPEDRTTVPLEPIIKELQQGRAPALWKERLWGTPRDWLLLERLSALPRLEEVVGQARTSREKRWFAGQGFKPEQEKNITEKSKERRWRDEHLFLDAKSKGIGLLLARSDCSPLGNRFRKLHRDPTSTSIFEPPHVLVTQSFRVAFCDFPVVFQHALQGIYGPPADRKLLMFLAAFLDSSLARYFLFHSAANWGMERSKVHLKELLRVPFPLPEDTEEPQRARSIVQEVAARMERGLTQIEEPRANRAVIVDKLRQHLQPLIYEYFGVDELEEVLIEDTLQLWMKSATPRRPSRHSWSGPPTLQLSKTEHRDQYLVLLQKVLNGWIGGGRQHVAASATMPGEAGLGLIKLSLEESRGRPPEVTQDQADSALKEVLGLLRKELMDRQGSVLALARGLKVFQGRDLYFAKPLERRFWSRTAALNDADAIFAESFAQRRQEEA